MKKIILLISGIMILATGIILKLKKSAAISIIGGADGPTAIFVAGKVGNDFSLLGIGVGVIIILISIALAIYKK